MRRRTQPALSRERVLRAALDLVDREGVEALTMRRLAHELGVTPMALYNHVGDKSELLDGIADQVVRELATPDAGLPWQERVRTCMTELRRVCLEHPNAVPLIQTTRATTPALLRPFELVVDALEQAGLPAGRALEAWSALVGLTLGHLTYQLGGHLTASRDFDFDDAFAFALDALIAGLSPPQPRGRVRGPARRTKQ